ncbi:MAG: carbohydrate binding family 9 domain-containing protein [Acidobacteria bacterium]|nr:carbohydrate binding family 9 domain-containing protein [Acidobacteriota bacterium]
MSKSGLRSRLVVPALALWFAWGVFPSYGQDASRDGATHGKRIVQARRTESPVVVDGSLEEPAWRQAPVSLGFIQKDPQEGQPSSETTEFRVIYTPTTLYVGVVCYDSNPAGILGTERRRDNTLGNDDTVTLVLDTFHDHRNAFMFRSNPLGARYDAMITDEGNDINASWDEQWEVASRITETGWVAEFAIPFKSLRVMEGNGHMWGIDVERVIRRKNEFSYWNSFHRGFRLENVSQGGHLNGIEDIETGLRLRIKPYLLGGFTQTVRQTPSGPDAFRTVTKNASDVGIEVLKYRITSSLTADATWNTDFAQTEVDNQQVNLDRFPLFFPEKREFFQEGAGIFEFGIARGEGPQAIMKLFHSRQIGLSPRRLPVPIVAGGRITGKVAGLTLGLLNVQTEAYEPESIPASNYSVVRVKRDVLARSSIGAYFLSREKAGSNDYNRVYGMDANFVFFRYLNVGGLLARSAEPRVEKDNWVSAGGVTWNSDFLVTGVSWLFVEPDFRDDIGFVPRKDMRQVTPRLEFFPRPRSSLIRQIRISARSDYTMNQNYELETRVNHYGFDLRFQNGSSLNFGPHTRLERIRQPFAIRPGEVLIPAGTYSWWYPRISYNANPAKSLSGSVSWQSNLGFWGGDMSELTFSPRLKLSEQASVEVSYEINKATFLQKMCVRNVAECGFTDHIVNTRVNYNFNNRWLTSATIQYNNADSFLGVNFRLNYIFRPGDDFFLIYNEGRRVSGSLDGQKDRTLQAKLTYSFDF